MDLLALNGQRGFADRVHRTEARGPGLARSVSNLEFVRYRAPPTTGSDRPIAVSQTGVSICPIAAVGAALQRQSDYVIRVYGTAAHLLGGYAAKKLGA